MVTETRPTKSAPVSDRMVQRVAAERDRRRRSFQFTQVERDTVVKPREPVPLASASNSRWLIGTAHQGTDHPLNRVGCRRVRRANLCASERALNARCESWLARPIDNFDGLPSKVQ